MSGRVPRLVEKYAKLSMENRDKLEQIIDGMLEIDEKKSNYGINAQMGPSSTQTKAIEINLNKSLFLLTR